MSEGEPRMSLDESAAIAEMLRDRFGLAFSHDSRPSLERRLRERLQKTRTPTFTDYVRLLRGDRGDGPGANGGGRVVRRNVCGALHESRDPGSAWPIVPMIPDRSRVAPIPCTASG